MFQLFRKNVLVNNLFLMLLVIVLRGAYWMQPLEAASKLSNAWVDDSIGAFTLGGTWGLVLSALTIFINAVLINRLSVIHRLHKEMTMIPGLLYVLGVSLIDQSTMVTPALICASIILLILSLMYSMYNRKDVVSKIFSIGILCGVAQLIYFPFWMLTIGLFFSMYLFKSLRTKGVLQFLFGVVVVYYLFGVYLVWQNGSLPQETSYFSDRVSITTYLLGPWSYDTIVIHVVWIIATGVCLLSFGSFSAKKATLVQRKISSIYVVMLFSFACLILHTQPFAAHFTVLLIPVCIILAHKLLDLTNKMIPELLVFFIAAVSLLTQFGLF